MPGGRKGFDITGRKFGKLTAIEDSGMKDKRGRAIWKCLCDCQLEFPEKDRQYTYVSKDTLLSGRKVSCGCTSYEKKHNKYDLSCEYGIGWTQSGYRFIFDIEDYEKIYPYTWHNSKGYLNAKDDLHKKENGSLPIKTITMARLLLDCPDNLEVDHINGKKWDNRKSNLRITNRIQNMENTGLFSTNSSGHKGVTFDKKNNKWMAYIVVNYKQHFLGNYDSFNEAVIARECAEHDYFGEYSRPPEFLNNDNVLETGGG